MFPCCRTASKAAASVGGIGDFCQRSGNKSDIEPSEVKSLNRYNTSTKYSHSLSPCRRALDNTDITIADQRADSGLPKNNQFFLPTTNSRNVRSETLLSIAKRPSVTQGTRSDWGNRWWERMWSVLATCQQQGRNVMAFLKSCMHAWIHGLAPPVLLKD